MRSRAICLMAAVFMCGVTARPALADPVPAVFPVSITASTLAAIVKPYRFTFALYDAAVGGTRLWSESKSYRLPASKKVTHQLGSVNPATNPISPLFFDRQLWVEASAAGKIFSRVKLTVVPYAVRSELAGNIEGRITDAQIDSGSTPAGAALTADGAGGASWQAVPGSGDVTAVLTLPGSGLAGGADAGEITLSVDTTAVQSRVTGVCGPDSSIRQVSADGTVVCEADDVNGPHVHSGADITSGTVAAARLSVGTTPGTVAAGDHGHPGMGDITGVQTPAGSGLSGGADTGSPSLAVDPGPGIAVSAEGVAVDFAGRGAASTVARSDHDHAVLGYNTGVGQQALERVTAGQNNTGVGAGALFSNDAGMDNVAVGAFALTTNAAGARNTAIGADALRANVSGSDNTAAGSRALYLNTTGSQNTALGQAALSGNTSGSASTAIGYQALRSNSSGASNTATGHRSLELNTSGFSNSAFGTGALMRNTTGYDNTAFGAGALASNATAWFNTAVGTSALSSNTAAGNTAVGANALALNTTGHGNTATGNASLRANVDGARNSAFGAGALWSNASGNDNTALGSDALAANVVGAANTAVGSGALASSTGAQNTATGYGALSSNRGGVENTASGSSVLSWNTSGSFNTASGSGALFSNQAGNYNAAFGYRAGESNLSGSSNTFIGGMADAAAADLANATAIGYYARVSQSNSLVLGGISGYAVNVGIGTTAPAHRLHVVGDLGVEGALRHDFSLRQKVNLWGEKYGIGVQNSRQYFRADAGQGFAWFAGGSHSDATDDPGPGGTLMMSLAGSGLQIGSTLGVGGDAAVGRDLTVGRTLDVSGALNVGVTAAVGGPMLIGGNLDVGGTITKGGGSFRIDHPLDPQNRYLSHSFVESPDMMNVYNGNVTTDGSGYATVELPAWFGALNRDFRYQLTVVDEADGDDFVQAKVVKGVAENRFTIRTSGPGVTVSWQVTGIRQDPYANAHRIPVEEEKPLADRGKCLHAEACGEQLAQGR